MDEFRHESGYINIAGRFVTQVILFFANWYAGRLVIDHLGHQGGQLNLNISPACLANPECVENIIPYVAIAVLGLAVENVFWRKITRGKDGTQRLDGGFKYQ